MRFLILSILLLSSKAFATDYSQIIFVGERMENDKIYLFSFADPALKAYPRAVTTFDWQSKKGQAIFVSSTDKSSFVAEENKAIADFVMGNVKGKLNIYKAKKKSGDLSSTLIVGVVGADVASGKYITGEKKRSPKAGEIQKAKQEKVDFKVKSKKGYDAGGGAGRPDTILDAVQRFTLQLTNGGRIELATWDTRTSKKGSYCWVMDVYEQRTLSKSHQLCLPTGAN